METGGGVARPLSLLRLISRGISIARMVIVRAQNKHSLARTPAAHLLFAQTIKHSSAARRGSAGGKRIRRRRQPWA